MNDNGEWPPEGTPHEPFVLVWHDPRGGLRGSFHRKNGCEWSQPGYLVGGKYVFIELHQATDRFGMRCCKKCAKLYEPTLIQTRLMLALDRLFELRPGAGVPVSEDLGRLEQALAEAGLEVVRKKGT